MTKIIRAIQTIRIKECEVVVCCEKFLEDWENGRMFAMYSNVGSGKLTDDNSGPIFYKFGDCHNEAIHRCQNPDCEKKIEVRGI